MSAVRRRKARQWRFRPVAEHTAYVCAGCSRSWEVFTNPGDEPDLRGCPGCGLPFTREEFDR